MTTHFSSPGATTKTMNRRRPYRPLLSAAALALLTFSLSLALWSQTPPDADPPQIRILEGGTALADGRSFNRAATPVVEVTDASAVTVDARLDGAAFTSGTQVSGEGTHQLAVTATDAAGNTASLAVGFEIDTTPPAFTAVLPANDSVTAEAQVTLQGHVSGASAVTVDGQPATLAGQDFTAGPYTLAQGTRTWTIAAADTAGNTAQWTHRIVRDSQAPTVAIAQPVSGAVVKSAAVDVVGSAQDARLAGVTVNGVAATVNGTTWLAPQVPLVEGSNTLVAHAEDRAGNAAEVSRTVVRDSQPPVLAVTDPSPGTVVPGATITLRGSAADPHLDRVEVNGTRAQLAAGVWSLAVTLREGNNDFAVQAFDSVGNVAAVTASVTRDSEAPAVAIVQPADGARLGGQTVTVSGTVAQKPGLTVTVNGSPATVTGGVFSLPGVALVEGENTLIARARDSLGNEGTYTRRVVRDTAAPTLLASDPGAGALALPVDAVFRLTFSEAMAAPAAGSWRLETGAGQAIAAAATLVGDLLTVRPAAPLPSSTQVRLVLTVSLSDLAGNPLASPPTLAFFTADTAAPGAPDLSPVPAHALCATTLTLAGAAEAGAIVRVQGAAAAAEARADETGHFTVAVQLVPEGINLLRLNAVDPSGNVSDAVVAEVIADCQPPRVLAAERQGNSFRITFSEAVTVASLAQAVALSSSQGAIAGSVSLGTDGKTATFTPSASLPQGALRLEVSAEVRDLAGNAMAFPWSQVLGAQAGDGFVSGTVIDDATGRPLAGARVVVFATNGTELSDPKPEQVTGADGRFRLPVPAGTHDLTIARPGYTSAFRVAITAAGQGIDIFDPRLTPAAGTQTIGAAGGVWGSGSDPLLTLPAGALAGSTAVAATRLSEQGLPATLPYGWSPRGAVWLDLGGAPLLAQSTLSLPVESPDGTTLTLVRLDLATLQWRVLGTDQVAGGRVAITLPAAAAGLTDGGYAAVDPDQGATAPPAAVTGTVLAGSPRPAGSDVTSAALSFDPQVVLPGQSSLATVTYTTIQEVASGLPLTLVVQENLTLLDDSSRRQTPYQADLILYHAPAGAARSRFLLSPSETARTLPLKMGAEDVTLRGYGEAVEGNVVGPEGGTVADSEGDRADLPAGALADPTAVTLTRKTAQDLPLAVPAGTELAGAVDLDLGGRSLLMPAALSLALSPTPAVGEKGLLLAVVNLESGLAWRPVAALQATATGWTTAPIDAADLPWPGVRDEGLYAFVRLTGSFGYLRGTVFDVGGAPLSGALVRGAGLSWVQIAGADGRYALPALAGTVNATAENPATGNLGAASAAIPAADDRVNLDITLAATGPHVLQITPADGAVDVPQGIQPTVRFSEAVAPASVTSAIQLLQAGEPVAINLDVQGGALVRVTPRSTLLPGSAYELRVGTGVRDLQGNPLEAPAAATFTTRRILESHDLDLSRVFLVEPDANGDAHVIGRAGAVPAGTLVFVENRSALANTPSVDAGTDGAFSLALHAALTHRLVLHALIQGGNEVVVELTPFHTADLKGAYVGAQALTFTTGDGVTVKLAAGTFAGPTRVRVEPHAAANVPLLSRQQLAPVYAFDLDLGGAQANKAPQITVPLPAGAPTPAGGFYLLNRVTEALGERHWMMHDLMVADGHGGLTTEVGTSTAALDRVQAVVAALDDPFAFAAAGDLPPVLKASAIVPEHKKYVPGASFAGQYQVEAPLIPLGFTVFPSFNMNVLVESWDRGLEGIFTSLNQSVERLLDYDAVLIPVRLDTPLHLVVRDLQTGFRLFDGTFNPPTGTDPVVLPPDQFGDHKPPFPVGGGPVRFFALDPGLGEQELAVGIKLKLDPGSSGNSQRSVTITGEADATDPQSDIQLIGLDDDIHRSVTSAGNGAFTLAASVDVKHRYVLAIGAQIASDAPLEISFNEAIADGFEGVEVRDPGGKKLSPRLDPVGSQETVLVRPEAGWRAGETYTLRLAPALADDAGNKWDKTLEIRFKIASSRELDTYKLDTVRDVARLGSWLFVAADSDGMVILDASDPAHLHNLIAGDVKFPFPFKDPVRGIAIDPHGRVLIVGGGVTGFGQLKIFDPLALDPLAVASNPEDPTVLYAAFKGSTILSDKLGGPGTQLPAGTPRRLSVLSNDQKDEWTLGDPAPAGLQVQVSDPPSASGEVTVTVSGQNGTADHPVSLFDLDLGRWHRIDVESNGHFELSLDVHPGDHLRLLRNVKTLAYVATQGVGVEVVDVDAFYKEDHTTPGLSVQSDVIGIYSGYQDPDLRLCGERVAELGTALIDVDTLFDTDNLHPLTLVGLVGDKGLVLLDSNASDPGKVSFLNEACAEVDGNANVTGLQVLQSYRFDLDDDGKLKPEEARDYALVTHRVAGLLIFDVTDRKNITLVGRIRLPGNAAHLSVDPEHRRAYVSGYSGGLYVVDLDHKPSLDLLDVNGDGTDNRVVETVTLPGNTNNAPRLIPELGIALAGGLNRGLTSLTVSGPLVQAFAREEGGAYRQIDHLAPFGVPTAKESSDPDAKDLAGSFVLRAHLPGILGTEVRVDLVSLGAGGKEIQGLGDPQHALADLPKAKLAGTTDGIELTRLSDNPYEDGYNLYQSKEIAAIADVRAAHAYHRTEDETNDCTRCSPPDKALEILSGDSIAVRFPEALRTQLEPIYDAEVLRQSQIAIGSVRWEIVPALRQEPALNPSHGRGDAFPGTLLHSGEVSLQQTDLSLKGRGFDLAFTRVYRSQTIGAGPLGPGWDYLYDQRLRELPNGDVEYYDGRGRRELFEKQDDDTLKAPAGRFVTLERSAAGWILIDPRYNLARFDRFGRLVSVSDAIKDSEDTGNEMLFGYDLSSHLVRITDTLDRVTLFGYDDEGRLEKIEDPTGREVTFKYDPQGRLETVTSPKIETGETTFPEGLTTRYAYESASGSALQAVLNQRDNLASVKDPRDTEWLGLVYADADHDGRADEVTRQTWGDGTVSLSYDFEDQKATVTDRLGHDTEYHHDEDGHPTSIKDPSEATTAYEYDDEGLVTSMTEPLGRKTTYAYDSGDSRRSRGNVTMLKVAPGSGGVNGSSGDLTTSISYDGQTNQPTQIVDPRGTTTRIDRDAVGQPTAVVRAAGTEAESSTSVSYNPHGQPERITNANGHATRYEYSDKEENRGCLERATADDGSLSLVTRYETDNRGNVTRMIDPRGISHDRKWNEVDWLIEATEPLGYETKYHYDAAGNMIEQGLPFDDGGAATKIIATYGKLDEVLSVEREISPGGERARDAYTYDANLNVTEHTAPEQQTTQWTYDNRDLPVQIVHGAGSADSVTETATYDAERRLTDWTDGRSATWHALYDGFGRVSETRDPLGDKSTVTYDNNSNPVERKAFDASHLLLAHEEAEFDPLNRQTVQRRKLFAIPGGASEDVVTQIEYDPLGHVTKTTDPLQRVSEMEYDGAERLIKSTDPAGNHTSLDLDESGNVTHSSTQERSPSGGVSVEETATYDDRNRRITSVNGEHNTRKWTYDVRGNVRLETDPENHSTELTYDGLDRLVKTVQPGGIMIEHEYDRSGRPISYKDALHQTTSWSYDDLDRRIRTTYPDQTFETYAYDGAGGLVHVREPRGTLFDQDFDDAGRLISRHVSNPLGVIGPLSENYTYDGLDRVTRAQSGDVITERTYDSLSRLISETTGEKTVSYQLDKAGNAKQTSYPSGHRVDKTFDPLDLPLSVAAAGEPLANYGWRGQGLPVQKDLGNGVAGTAQFDLAGRMINQAFNDPQQGNVFQENLAWSPRDLKVAQSRGDLNGTGFKFGYDDAGRVTEAERSVEPVPTPNNTVSDPQVLAGLSNVFSFRYDAAQNLIERSTKTDDALHTDPLPLDGSGRNRPSSIGIVPLEWDANGNLARKGNFRFLYDYRNRLTRVTDLADNPVATYVYDAFNRRISKTVGGDVQTVVWDGWQAIEEYKNGELDSRRSFGAGLDEIVQLENLPDSNGNLQEHYFPVYDESGNMVAASGRAGKPVERYAYSPYGEQTITVDLTPPVVEQARVKNGALWLEMSEEISSGALTRGLADHKLTLTDLDAQHELVLGAILPVQNGRQARRRIWLTPTAVPATGTQVKLTIQPEAIKDLFLNKLDQPYEITFAWPAADALLSDAKPLQLDFVGVAQGVLQVGLTEEPDLATANALQIDGAPAAWTLSADRYILTASTALGSGSHTLTIGTTLKDLGGNALAGAFTNTFTLQSSGDARSLFAAPDPRKIPVSSIKNPFGYHGMPKDLETGFVYMRNRYYDPEMGRFITMDPLGYVDGPSQYGFAKNDPINGGDSLGLQSEPQQTGWLYKIEGELDGKPVKYTGSTATELQARFSKHQWKALMQSENTKISVKRTFGNPNVEASNSGTPRGAKSEAVRGPEQDEIDKTRSEVENSNKNRGPGEPETEILNQRQAAKDPATLKVRHEVTVEEEWTVVKEPGGTAVLPKVFAAMALWDAYRMTVEKKKAEYTWAPYVLEDEKGAFTLNVQQAGLLGLFESKYSKSYIAGELKGQNTSITGKEFDSLRTEAEALYGTTDWMGNFVPGLLRPSLPSVCHDCG